MGITIIQKSDLSVRKKDAKVALVLGRGRGLERDALDDLQAVAAERHVLRGVVGHQPHAADAELAQDLRADAVIALGQLC